MHDIQVFDIQQATDDDFTALNRFENLMRQESWPDEPPRTLEETRSNLLAAPPFVHFSIWLVRQQSEIIARAMLVTWDSDTNQHIADASISVVPSQRRQGIAKGMLERIHAEAGARSRRLLIGNTQVPAGADFMKHLGAREGLTMRTSELKLTELDYTLTLLERWIEEGKARGEDFELGLWDGAYPESDYNSIIALQEVMNTAPRDALEIEDQHLTPQQLKEIDETIQKRGIERLTLYARHKATGDLAGYTVLHWNPQQPATLEQGDTGVFPQYRGQGLGRYLKAELLKRTLERYPQATRVLTGNAFSNAPMLRINEAMGFKQIKANTVWQLDVDRLTAYLEGQRESA